MSSKHHDNLEEKELVEILSISYPMKENFNIAWQKGDVLSIEIDLVECKILGYSNGA